MAVRTDVTVDWSQSPRIIEVAAPSTEITIQDLHDTCRDFEDSLPSGMQYDQLISSAGKEELGGGVLVGITSTLQNALLQFEARAGPTYTQCKVSGGNLVAVDENGDTQTTPINPTAFTQVVITASSSATLSDLEAIQYSSYGGGVSVDITSSNSGTTYPVGNQEYPVNNLVDAVSIANEKGFDHLFIRTSMTLDSGTDMRNFHIEGKSHVNTVLTIDTNAQVDNVCIANAHVTGVLDGGVEIKNCVVGDITYVNGHIHDSSLYGTIYLDGNEDAVLVNCIQLDGVNRPNIDMGGSGQNLSVTQFTGVLEISNLTGYAVAGIGLSSGSVTIESSVSAGVIIVTGIGRVTDNSTGSANVITTGLLNKADIAEAVWDETEALTVQKFKGLK
jgi:hypothetical protein